MCISAANVFLILTTNAFNSEQHVIFRNCELFSKASNHCLSTLVCMPVVELFSMSFTKICNIEVASSLMNNNFEFSIIKFEGKESEGKWSSSSITVLIRKKFNAVEIWKFL